MSTETTAEPTTGRQGDKGARRKPRRRKPDPGPALPLQEIKPAWQPSLFRRTGKGRTGRLYARLRDAGGKIIIRSTGVSTMGAAAEWMTLAQKHLAGGAL